MASTRSSDAEIREVFASLLPPRAAGSVEPTEMGAGSDDLEPGRRYLAGAVDGGWAVPHWPARHGGRDADRAEVARIARIRADYLVPDLYAYAIGLGIAGPTLLTHATEAQCDRWLRSIADGSEIWCQLFSEPEAGSDLANAGLQATLDGDEWQLNGQKVWASRAMWARWGLILARTNPALPKHRGLTMFVIDMSAPGVDVRPLVQMNGDRHFSEVFLDDVRVPDAQRVGEPGSGWSVAMTVLTHERSSAQSEEGPAGRMLPAWLTELGTRGRLADPVVRQRAMTAFIRGRVASWNAARSRQQAGSRTPGPAGSGAKLERVRQYKLEANLVKDSFGPHGMLDTHDGHVKFLTAPSMSIRGGTDEIQRNIMGERVLGLPSEPRLDRDVPWRDARRGVL